MPPVAILSAKCYFKILSVEKALQTVLQMSETKRELNAQRVWRNPQGREVEK